MNPSLCRRDAMLRRPQAHRKGAVPPMIHRSRIAAILAALILLTALSSAGCAGVSNDYRQGSDTWTWARKGNAVEIQLNGRLYTVIQSGIAKVYLPDGRSLDVSLDREGSPVSVTRLAWEVSLTQQDYQQMSTAFNVYKEAVAQQPAGKVGWVVFLLVVILAGVLLFVYAGSLVNSWKLGGIFSGTDTARTLLLFKAVGILVIVVGAVILLAVLFK